MTLVAPRKLNEILIHLLRGGEKKATQLVQEVKSFKRGATKQAVYAALRKLKAEEVVVMYKGIVALNSVWVKDMRRVVEQMSRVYEKDLNSFDFLSLENKESVLYRFSQTLHLDAFWGHVQSLLISATPKNEAIYAYDPHYWFYIGRKKTERKLLDDIARTKRQFLMTVGGSMKLDKVIKSEFTGDDVQYAIKRIFDKPEYYATAIGDYVVEVFLNKSVAKAIEDIYANHDSITEEVVNKLEMILQSKAPSKIKISRNKKKADDLRRKLQKSFYVKP